MPIKTRSVIIIEREERRIERAIERENLKRRYQNYKVQFQPELTFNKGYFEWLYKQLQERAKQKREQIQAEVKDYNMNMRKVLYSLLAFEKAKERLSIKILSKEERQRLKTNPANKRMIYQEWVNEQAQQGDKAAISQLMGFDYAQKRMIKKRLR